MKTWKQYLPDVLVILLFAAISFAYFFPADIEGKILFRHDSAASKGLGRELSEHREKTGEQTRWMNSVFSGMPTYQTAPSYSSTDGLGQVVKAYHLFLPENVWYVFAYLLGFYILLRAFDFRQSLAALGSIIWAFSSYFFIIIAAGHIWKVMALAYLPPMIAGVVLAYRGKYLWGLIVTALFTAFEVNANHVQMTYYFLFVILFMVIAYLVDAIRNHNWLISARPRCVCCRCHNRYMHQPEQPLSHMGVQPGVDARQERTGEKEHGKPDKQRTRPRLYNAVELRHRRDMDSARAQHQGRRINAFGTEQDCHGTCRSTTL